MSFTNKEELQYLGIKSILSILYSDNYDYDFEYVRQILNIDDISTLYMLSSIIEVHQHVFDEQMKKNASQLVDYFRFDYVKEHPEQKSQVFKIANEVISQINTCDDSQMILFVAGQMRLRYYLSKGVIGSVMNPELALPYLKINNKDDFHMIVMHSDLCSDEEFEEYAKVFSKVDFDYIANMSAIITECPTLLKDPVFYSRLKEVTEKLHQNLEQTTTESSDSIPIKDIKKMYKKYLKAINIREKRFNIN